MRPVNNEKDLQRLDQLPVCIIITSFELLSTSITFFLSKFIAAYLCNFAAHVGLLTADWISIFEKKRMVVMI